MNRVIQFRCFYRGVLYPVKEMQFDTDGSFSVSIIEMDLDDLGVRDVSPDSEHIEGIMQCTGLKDKTGKDIFEGDVIKWRSTHRGANGGEHIDVMEWQDKHACFLLMPFVHEPYAAEMEVIGNILEHKHLLK